MDLMCFGTLDLSFGLEDINFGTLGVESAVTPVSGGVVSMSPGVSPSTLPVVEDATGSPVLGSSDLGSPPSRRPLYTVTCIHYYTYQGNNRCTEMFISTYMYMYYAASFRLITKKQQSTAGECTQRATLPSSCEPGEGEERDNKND